MLVSPLISAIHQASRATRRTYLHASLTIIRRAMEGGTAAGQHIVDQIRAYNRTSESYGC
jgi:hypothetical protein